MLEINLKQLESFVATVEHSGFTAAAAALYLTQSTVSAHVSALEQTLGVPLLVRGARRPVTLTPEGQNVYAQAREILNRCERLQALGPAEQPPLRLGASTAPGQGLLPELLTGFLQRCPDSRYVLLRGDSARIHSLMLDSRVHLGFVGAAMDPRRFVYHPIANDRLVLVAPNREPYPTLQRQGVSGLTLLTQQPLIRREPASGTRAVAGGLPAPQRHRRRLPALRGGNRHAGGREGRGAARAGRCGHFGARRAGGAGCGEAAVVRSGPQRRVPPHLSGLARPAAPSRPPSAALRTMCSPTPKGNDAAAGIAAAIRRLKAPGFVIARRRSRRGDLGKAAAISPMAFPHSDLVLRDCTPRALPRASRSGRHRPLRGLAMTHRGQLPF